MAAFRALWAMLCGPDGKLSATRFFPAWLLTTYEAWLHVVVLGLALEWWDYTRWQQLHQDILIAVVAAFGALGAKIVADSRRAKPLNEEAPPPASVQ